MPRVRFLKEFKNSDNGYTIVTHPAGSEAEVSESCARGAVSVEAAELIGSEDQDTSTGAAKAHGQAPKNKAR